MQRRREHMTLQDILENKQKLWKIFRGSKFYVSVMLILSTVFTMTIPQITIVILKQSLRDYVVLDSVKICFEITFFIDTCIYIIIHPAVRRLLLKKFHLYKADSKKPHIRVVRLDRTMNGRDITSPKNNKTVFL